jgi:hypothetical protein
MVSHEAIQELVSQAIEADFYTADGERVMLALDDLESLGVDMSKHREMMKDKIRQFDAYNAITE